MLFGLFTSIPGLGSDRKQDPWVDHNTSFTQILNDLNAANQKVDGVTSSKSNKSTKSEGLESKSKASRSRIQ